MSLQVKKKLLIGIVLLAALVVFASLTIGGCNIGEAAKSTGLEDYNTPVSLVTGSIPPGLGPDSIADIVANAGAAVVKVDTVTKVGTPDTFFDDPFFRQFLGTPFQGQQQLQEGVGSGFLISEDGYIITNDHVVDGASEIKITVSGYDNYFNATVVGSDYDLDLAVLKIQGSNFPYLSLGDSDQVRVGEWVIAIGNPFGLDHTVTVGVISAKGRPITVEDRNYENLLQTDASINPGNSGGPLLNLAGQVVGINTAINSQAQGIGFAIPTSTVQGVLQTLMSSGQVARPWLGVSINDVTPEIAEYFGLSKAEGAVVLQISQDSPAAEAGLKRGDIIQEFNGQKITKADELVKAIQNTSVGQQVQVNVFRSGNVQQLDVTIAQKPAR